MKARLATILSLLFFAGGTVVVFLNLGDGVLGHYFVEIPFLKAFESYILLVLYGFAFVLALTLFFGKKPRGAKGLFSLVAVLLILIYGYALYNEISFGLFFMGGGHLDKIRAVFLTLGVYFSLHLFFSIRARGKIKE